MTTDGKGLRAAIYCRVSSEAQRERHTIDSQKRLLPEYVRAQGWKPLDPYIDDGFSGETIEDRPAFTRLLRDVNAGLVDVVVCIDLDRITRSKRGTERAYIFDTLREQDVRVATPSNGLIDLNNEDQDLQVDLLGAVGKHEKRKILKRMARGKRESARKGKRFSCSDPYGYRGGPDGYVIVPAEAAIVRRIYQSALDGLGVNLIVDELRSENLMTRGRGKHPPALFSPSTVRKILRSTTYCGEFRVFKSSEPITIQVPAIIDPDRWLRTQDAITERRSDSRWKHAREYLLANVARCGVCEAAMWVVNPKANAKTPTAYYRCASTNAWRKMGRDGPCGQKHHKVAVVDAAIWASIVDVLSNPTLLRKACKLSAEQETQGVDWAGQLAQCEKKLRELDQHVAETNRRLRRGLLTAEQADRELEEIARERKLLERNRAMADRQASRQQAKATSVAALEAQAQALAKALPGASFERKRELVRALFPSAHGCRVTIHHDGRLEASAILPVADEGIAAVFSAVSS